MSYIEDIIRNEVQNIANMQTVPDEDLPYREKDEMAPASHDGFMPGNMIMYDKPTGNKVPDLEEVPAHDLPDTVLGDYGLNSDNMVQNDTTLSQILTGRGVEPNEALEGSALDPLTGALIGAGLKGTVSQGARYVDRGANRWSTANKVKDDIPVQAKKIDEELSFDNLGDMANKMKDKAKQMEQGEINLPNSALEMTNKATGGRIPGLSHISDFIGSLKKLLTSPISPKSMFKVKAAFDNRMKSYGYTKQESDAIWGQLKSDKYIGNPVGTKEFDEIDTGVAMDLFNDGSRAVDGAIRNRAKQSATNKLFGRGADTIGIKEMPPRKRISEPRTSIGNGGGVVDDAPVGPRPSVDKLLGAPIDKPIVKSVPTPKKAVDKLFSKPAGEFTKKELDTLGQVGTRLKHNPEDRAELLRISKELDASLDAHSKIIDAGRRGKKNASAYDSAVKAREEKYAQAHKIVDKNIEAINAKSSEKHKLLKRAIDKLRKDGNLPSSFDANPDNFAYKADRLVSEYLKAGGTLSLLVAALGANYNSQDQ